MRGWSTVVRLASVAALASWAACGGDDGNATGDTGSDAQTSTGIDVPMDDGDDDGGDTSTGTADGTGTAGTGGVPAGGCGGTIYACSDGIDNDDDGLIDSDDPECTGACDNDESSFQTGIPGDNMDCKQDCFFDGNSGQGDDGCLWHLACDPANPGEGLGCDYTGGNNCDNFEVQTQACIDFCSQLVPNGCDCFGCCEVVIEGETIYVYLGSGPDCSIATLENCNSCTPSEDCGNPCNPEDCEVCFGMTEPMPGCDLPECPDGQTPCTTDGEGGSTCPEGLFCLTGCCIDYDPQG